MSNQQKIEQTCNSYQIILSDELSISDIEDKFKNLFEMQNLETLVITIKYIQNLPKVKHHLNDIFFRLSYSRYFYIDDQHHYLDLSVKIQFEIDTFQSDSLFNSLNFLSCLQIQESNTKRISIKTDSLYKRSVLGFECVDFFVFCVTI